MVPKHAVRGARSRSREGVRGRRAHPVGVRTNPPVDLPGEAEPRGLPGGCSVVDARRSTRVEQFHDLAREVPAPRRLPTLVVNDGNLRLRSLESEHGPTKFVPCSP